MPEYLWFQFRIDFDNNFSDGLAAWYVNRKWFPWNDCPFRIKYNRFIIQDFPVV